MTLNDDQLTRQFLVSLCGSSPGGEIKLPMAALDAVDENGRLRFRRAGKFIVLSVKVVKDRWGRIVDRCGQVKCLDCDTYINYDYPDGSKRTHCAQHESREGRK
jgi:hypothetical protein